LTKSFTERSSCTIVYSHSEVQTTVYSTVHTVLYTLFWWSTKNVACTECYWLLLRKFGCTRVDYLSVVLFMMYSKYWPIPRPA